MRDFLQADPETEARAREIDPEAWRSSDTQAEAFELRYRRNDARRKAGWRGPLRGQSALSSAPGEVGE